MGGEIEVIETKREENEENKNRFENAIECLVCFELFEDSTEDLKKHVDDAHKAIKLHQ